MGQTNERSCLFEFDLVKSTMSRDRLTKGTANPTQARGEIAAKSGGGGEMLPIFQHFATPMVRVKNGP